jgi:hypothetical protein
MEVEQAIMREISGYLRLFANHKPFLMAALHLMSRAPRTLAAHLVVTGHIMLDAVLAIVPRYSDDGHFAELAIRYLYIAFNFRCFRRAGVFSMIQRFHKAVGVPGIAALTAASPISAKELLGSMLCSFQIWLHVRVNQAEPLYMPIVTPNVVIGSEMH